MWLGACSLPRSRWPARRGARKLTLRVLASNPGAIRVYQRAGFVEEGRLTGLFLLEGQYVDDLLMSLDLSDAHLARTS